MSKRLELTADEVLYFWSCSILGGAKQVKPKGANFTSSKLDLMATIAVCARAVEGTKGYDRDIVLGWVDARGLNEKQFWKFKDFEYALIQNLAASPVYPVTKDDEETGKTAVTFYDLTTASELMKVPRATLQRWLVDCSTSYTHGTVKTSEGWRIYAADFDEIREKSQKYKKVLTPVVACVNMGMNRAS